ncbi:unnamed protein product [Plutella xylostella]|uniref:(diamondback moth) hypothetical protein n=1 Tax=Plutella xylostella TaxID=51655 RepID=A0A8S4FVJ6_PLUXY|nr:unnamed protein product [Plutella xylostella]
MLHMASDRSPFDGSCCSGYRPVDSASLTTPDDDDMEPDPITKYRVVLLGDAGVGKTALVSQFMTSEYMNTYDASLGVQGIARPTRSPGYSPAHPAAERRASAAAPPPPPPPAAAPCHVPTRRRRPMPRQATWSRLQHHNM